MKANHKQRFVPLKIGKGITTVNVGKGCFIFGRNKAAEYFGWKPTTIYKRMLKLAELGCVLIESDKQYSIVSICNWEVYQPDENEKCQPSDNQVTTKCQPSDNQVTQTRIIKHYKNDKKETYNVSVSAIFDYWKKIHNHERSKLDDKRKKLITARLKEGYTEDDLKLAIDGCKKSSFHQGQNEDKKIFDSIGLIMRDADNVDRFMNYKNSGKEKW